MTRRNVPVLALLVVGFSATFAAVSPAVACTEPEFTLLTDSAGPGDRVDFTVSNTEPNASFSLSIEGWHQSFTDDSTDQGYRGSFTLPDLGDGSRPVYVQFAGGHDDQAFASQGKELQYVADAPAPPPSEGEHQSNGENDARAGEERRSSQADTSGAADQQQHDRRDTATIPAQPAGAAGQQNVARDVGHATAARGRRAKAVTRTRSRPAAAPALRVWELRNEGSLAAALPAKVAPPARVIADDGEPSWLRPLTLIAALIAVAAAGLLRLLRRRPDPAADLVPLDDIRRGERSERAA